MYEHENGIIEMKVAYPAGKISWNIVKPDHVCKTPIMSVRGNESRCKNGRQ